MACMKIKVFGVQWARALWVNLPLWGMLSGCASGDLQGGTPTPTSDKNSIALSATATPSAPFVIATLPSGDALPVTATIRVTGVREEGKPPPSRPWKINDGETLPFTTTSQLAVGQEASISVRNVDWDLGQVRIEIEVNGNVVNIAEGTGVPVLSCHYRRPPSGATAACSDRTFSYSKNRQGSCSNHGGVDFFYLPDGGIDPDSPGNVQFAPSQ